ncbi:MAG: clan AA aspartic protease [Ferruginibacter sp.]|nr:clan AA aspartic protease [Cytophagales bacterium]
MGFTYATIQLLNTGDIEVARRGYIPKGEIRRMEVTALVDSGAIDLCINETIKQQLGLTVLETHSVKLADGTERLLEIAGPVDVRFLNRSTTVRAIVLPGDNEVLLGAIPLEGMDVIIDPLDQQLKLPPDRPYLARSVVK